MNRRTVTVTVTTPAPAEVVWHLLATAQTWPRWAPVRSARLEVPGTPTPDGVGAVRRFRTWSGTTRERVVEFERPTHFAYVLESGLPLRSYRSDVTLDETGAGTTIRWSSSFGTSHAATGWLWSLLVHAILRSFARSLARGAGRRARMRPRRAPAGVATVLILAAAAVVVATNGDIGKDAQASPRDAPIAFVRSVGHPDDTQYAEIFRMEHDGSGLRRLTTNRVEDNFPAISPDGNRIAFTRMDSGVGHIYVMGGDGGDARRITNVRATDALPAWSPDGRWIVFTRHLGGQSDIFKIPATGGAAIRLTSSAAHEFTPRWSPDGALIAFSKSSYSTSRYGIGVMDADGGATRWLTVNPLAKAGHADVNPTWSPSGRHVAFAGEDEDLNIEIYTVRRDGSGRRRLTDLRSEAQQPSWGPKGRIAFTYNGGIATLRANGTDLDMLTPDRTTTPALQPDSAPDWQQHVR